MGKLEKLLKRLDNHNTTWVWSDLTRLLKLLGYIELKALAHALNLIMVNH